ncbi:RICIN domain-containing protein [Saccharothrix sp. NRRL B-16348]|uniref:RICIN domain-containing protein n=1 Tax=Saccharothrix sp. NRRL B-16348 TaxID=1415542 RepID=UPI000AA74A03
MRVVIQPANDNTEVAAVTYGPVVLSGNHGDTAFSTLPSLATASVTRTSSSSLAFTATADGATVNLGPFYDAHGHNYTVYWNTGSGSNTGYCLFNAASGMVLGIRDMSTADGGSALQWGDTGTPDHNWHLVIDGAAVRLRNLKSDKVLGILNGSTAQGAQAVQDPDNGSTTTTGGSCPSARDASRTCAAASSWACRTCPPRTAAW